SGVRSSIAERGLDILALACPPKATGRAGLFLPRRVEWHPSSSCRFLDQLKQKPSPLPDMNPRSVFHRKSKAFAYVSLSLTLATAPLFAAAATATAPAIPAAGSRLPAAEPKVI